MSMMDKTPPALRMLQPGPVRAGQDRTDEPLLFLNGRFDCKVSGAETDGQMCVFDTYRTRKGGPPVHLHHDVDEWFFVIEGRFRLRVGDDLHLLGPGDSILGPRGVPHAFACLTDTARMVIMFQPAGTMEHFFRDGARFPDLMAPNAIQFALEHNMDTLGPPLSTEV